MNKLVFCAMRENRGATGGPGGVLYIQKELLGSEVAGLKSFYYFNYFKIKSRIVSRILNSLYFLVFCCFQRRVYYIVHDIELAFILSILRKKYTLIYHSQGPVVEEIYNMGELTSVKKKYYQMIERRAFLKAFTLHFPSKGAENMYFKSKYSTCKKDEVNVGEPLYNTIPLVTVAKPHDFNLEETPDTLTFFSLGTLTFAKGQDQSIDFLKKFLDVYKKNVRYIMVGKGPLKDQLIEQLEKMKSQNLNFEYYYFENLSHDIIMYLHKISDIYLMIHRISIFDFATLEAMSQSSVVVLSRIGGNPEFNYDNNIIFAEDVLANMSEFVQQDFGEYKKKNKKVFEQYFSRDAYKKQYEMFVTKYVK